MSGAASEVIFSVEEAPEGGFVAHALGHSIFTEADTLDDLRNAVRRSSEGDPPALRAGRSLCGIRLPRDLSGQDLVKALHKLGYRTTRQTSSHIRLTTDRQGEHHVTIPDHESIRIGTLSGVLADLERHHKLSRDQLILAPLWSK